MVMVLKNKSLKTIDKSIKKVEREYKKRCKEIRILIVRSIAKEFHIERLETWFGRALRMIENLYKPKIVARDKHIIHLRIFNGVRNKLDEMKKSGEKMNISQASHNYFNDPTKEGFKALVEEYRVKVEDEDRPEYGRPLHYEIKIKSAKRIYNIFSDMDRKINRSGLAKLIKKQDLKKYDYY